LTANLFEIVVTRSVIFGSKFTKKPFGGRTPPGPAGRAYTGAPRPPSWIQGVGPRESERRREEGNRMDETPTSTTWLRPIGPPNSENSEI